MELFCREIKHFSGRIGKTDILKKDMEKSLKDYKIDFNDKFIKKISKKELEGIIGTEFDNSHYYFGLLCEMDMIEKYSISFPRTLDESKILAKFKKGDYNYFIYLRGDSKIMSFDGQISFDEKNKINKESFKEIINLINDNKCIEESIPFFIVYKESKENEEIKSYELMTTSFEEIIEFIER